MAFVQPKALSSGSSGATSLHGEWQDTLSSILPEVPSAEILRARLDHGLGVALQEMTTIIRTDEDNKNRVAAVNALANIGKLLHARDLYKDGKEQRITIIASNEYKALDQERVNSRGVDDGEDD